MMSIKIPVDILEIEGCTWKAAERGGKVCAGLCAGWETKTKRPTAAREGHSRAGQPSLRGQGREVGQRREAGWAHVFLIRGHGSLGCCHLHLLAIPEINQVFPHTLNPSQWVIQAPVPPASASCWL